MFEGKGSSGEWRVAREKNMHFGSLKSGSKIRENTVLNNAVKIRFFKMDAEEKRIGKRYLIWYIHIVGVPWFVERQHGC